MKKQIKFHSLSYILIASILIFFSCQDKIYETYELNNPVYLSYDELREAVSDILPVNLEHPGKIYIKGDLLFLNEVRKGIHVIDNSDPSNPQILKFIEIPGNIDMAVKDDVLYADSYIDLVVLDISDFSDIKEIERVEDVFSYSIPPYESQQRVGEIDQSMGVVIGWKTETVTKEITESFHYPFPKLGGETFGAYRTTSFSGSTNGGNGSTGTGGSMAKFIIYKNILYAIDQSSLNFFDISKSEEPWQVGNQGIGWNIETVFIARDHLFIGAQSGMYIYSLYDPVKPEYVSTYWHVTSCDPVVVEGNYAYITLRNGTLCETDVNQLDVVDVRNLKKPEKLKSYTMYNPHGLGIDDATLFVCDGEEGLKVYNAADPYNIKANKLAHFPEINAFDVIPINELLIMVGKDGIYQYNYTDVKNIELLSTLPIFSD